MALPLTQFLSLDSGRLHICVQVNPNLRFGANWQQSATNQPDRVSSTVFCRENENKRIFFQIQLETMKNFALVSRRCFSDIQKKGSVALENVERSLRVRSATRKFYLTNFFPLAIYSFAIFYSFPTIICWHRKG